MDWIQGIQKAIDYIESHLSKEIDYEALAKEACSSVFHFQRVFSVLCGFTVGDYIRLRRLSLAAEELVSGSDRIIDIALKYGYDSPESFSRAFARFHGVSPSEARKGGNVRTFTRLSAKLILTGGIQMDYRIEKTDAFKVICRRRQVNKPQDALATGDISGFWDECRNDGTLRKIIGRFPKDGRMGGLLGICFSYEMEGNRFPYAIGVEYDGGEAEDGLEIVEIPAHTYAVFPCKGKMPDVFGETYSKIVSEFFPQSTKYEYADGIEFEVYPSEDMDDPNYYCEIWIAVNEK